MSHPRLTTVLPAFYDGATRVKRGCMTDSLSLLSLESLSLLSFKK
jgi:hypothetical protein